MILKSIIKNQQGVTLMELLIYLAMSTVVVVGLSAVMTSTMQARVVSNSTKDAQQNARRVLENMTYSLRNAYQLDVAADGKSINIYSQNIDNPSEPYITTYKYDDSELLYAQAINELPAEDTFISLVDEGITVEDVFFNKIASSISVEFTTIKNNRKATINSTIAYRQL